MSKPRFSAAFRKAVRDFWLEDLIVISVSIGGGSLDSSGTRLAGARTRVGNAGLFGRR